ncbi:MAG: hypothetical protein WCP39_03645 [Chlamydiota bacterium]
MIVISKKIPFSKIAIFLLVLFLLFFPKGGFKIVDIPLTWGYMFLGLFSLFSFFRNFYRISKDHLYAFLATIPFQVIYLYTLINNGFSILGFVFALVLSFTYLPIVFFLLFSSQLEKLDLPFFYRLLKKGMLFVAIYGIFLFFYKQITLKFIEIPFLTVNFNDMGHLEEKHIDKGLVFKLISTYNNGNLYGIYMLMLLPLYTYLENSQWKKLIVRLALILTLSRTVWIGLLLHEILYSIFIAKNKKSSFWLSSLLFLGFFFLIPWYFKFSSNFLMGKNLGGRIDSFIGISDISFLSTQPFFVIDEIVYLGIGKNFGIFGLITFLFAMTMPLLLAFSKTLSSVEKALALGLCIYLIIAGADGALLLIPTMCFYWFIAAFLLAKHPQKNETESLVYPQGSQ